MKNQRSLAVGLLFAATVAVPMAVSGARVDVPSEVTVQFGPNLFPQPPQPLNHYLDPDEVTIVKGGTVTFEFNGNNHGVAIYPVSPTTTRQDIEAGLCQPDPATCNPQQASTADLEYFVMDGYGDVVIDTGTNPPNNRVNDPTDRHAYADIFHAGLVGNVYFTGRNATGAPAPQVQHKFEKIGRYLVICVNRSHFINDRMFGFVNVVRKRQNDASESE